MHSHHSHSGDYVSHAKDHLESIVSRAESMGFTHFCLTEHMPRLDDDFLYPEEIERQYTHKDLSGDFEKYLRHAVEVQKAFKEKNGMKILIGFEVEGIDDPHIQYARDALLSNRSINMSVGSVHYVNKIPIDFSTELWLKARDSTPEKTTRSLYQAYFEFQYKVISALKPQVIGHFDLIRLFELSDEVDPTTGKLNKDIDLENDWPEIWELIIRNIRTVNEYGGLFELNSAALRKGWLSPYPKQDISEAIKQYGGGRFCLSDDSHAINQVGLNFHKTWEYAKNILKLDYIYHLDLSDGNDTIIKKELLSDLDKSTFWDQYH